MNQITSLLNNPWLDFKFYENAIFQKTLFKTLRGIKFLAHRSGTKLCIMFHRDLVLKIPIVWK